MDHSRRECVIEALKGVSGVHVTPYDQRGEIDAELLAKVIDEITCSGVHNIVSGGNTGEFYTLSLAEVERLYQIAAETVDGRAIVTAGVGRGIREAVQLAKSAQASGVDAIMVHQPPDPFASPRMLTSYVQEIADHTDLPIIAYARQAALKPEDFVALGKIESVVAVKYAVPDPLLMAECMRATRDLSLQWICGLAESWALPFYAYGARGFTSGLVNINARLSMRFHGALENGDWSQARSLIEEIAEFEDLRTLENNGTNVTVVKEAMRIRGMDVGLVRAPGVDKLDESQHRTLARIVEHWS